MGLAAEDDVLELCTNYLMPDFTLVFFIRSEQLTKQLFQLLNLLSISRKLTLMFCCAENLRAFMISLLEPSSHWMVSLIIET